MDILEKLITGHREVSEEIEILKDVLSFIHRQDLSEQSQCGIKFFTETVLPHFEFEEKKVFPNILLKTDSLQEISFILQLQKEHGYILSSFDLAKGAVKERTLIFFRGIIDRLLQHAKKEDEKLLPLVKTYL